MAEPNLSPACFTEYNEQTQSSLFSLLPPEIRYEIFAYALTSAPDTRQRPERDGYCTRPGYETPHRTYTELLQTCRKVYMEAWFMPFICSEHAFWMASSERVPERIITVEKMQQCLDLIHDRHGEVQGGHIRVFPQLWCLEGTKDFNGIFAMRHFYPKSVTITIRYTDTWYWESNDELHIEGEWGRWLVLPSSVTRFCIDIESIERRKDEVDYIAGEMADRWRFQRADGTNMVAARADTSVSRWTGSSMLGGERWVRDEEAPGQLRYYFATITWRPSQEPLDDQGLNPPLEVDWIRPSIPDLGCNYIEEADLDRLGISMTVPAEQAVAEYIADRDRRRDVVEQTVRQVLPFVQGYEALALRTPTARPRPSDYDLDEEVQVLIWHNWV
ncbi:hypothetical protein DTO013E5_6252 [Penicillium roqueforti]|uniref:Uncharacterized protein n=1 Tax=Penicillium roqueforti (strain FM164) TaxID=1365484 RepID=W6QUA8_PENRF|nr:uncharacterized protein LCP9604111_5217 [Penicillium roqueforti]CDM37714.1 unnamed protein product [Penicillium roqueforti FM164]KAF9248467.1 hypothetical protein LCP9604111_5217 [Penicillium roqueforti]KAI1831086.1 hypothetical protein CBS147337_8152 [Penicillium roqueforti]KAI2674064.1 hypothetical protein CBS147355_7239 [Penicillium roqueforti]KAI2682171.1 hypothetical protein LCP963914a_6586 [Penicillium roqueforti]